MKNTNTIAERNSRFLISEAIKKIWKGNSRQRLFLFFFAAYVVTACFSLGAFHADEHFQILEFANWKMGGLPESSLPWEFQEQMRSSLQPSIVCCVWYVLEFMDCYSPFRATLILRLVSAVMALGVAMLLLRKIDRDFPSTSKWNLLLFFGLWFSVYCGVRYSSENWSGLLFALGFARVVWQPEKRRAGNFFLAGFFLGLAFAVRFQVALLATGLVAWLIFVRKTELKYLLLIAAGSLPALAIGALSDRWFYGEWVLTSWNYLNRTLINSTNKFGTEPWYHYFEILFFKGVPPVSIVVMASVILCFVLKPKHALSFSLFPFIIAHFIIAHKEIRFMFPLVPLIPLALVVAFHAIKEKEKYRRWFNAAAIKLMLRIAVLANVCILPLVIFCSGNSGARLFHFLYALQEKEQINVYCLDYNHVGMAFYKGPDMNWNVIAPASNGSILPEPGEYLAMPIHEEKQFEKLRSRLELVYSGYPEWMLKFDYCGWIKRTGVWRVYRVKRNEPEYATGCSNEPGKLCTSI